MLKVVGASWMQIRMSTWIIGVVLVLGIVVIILGQMGQTEEDGNYSATAYWNKETGFEIRFWGQGTDKDKVPKGAARIYFQPHVDTTGWAIIDIETQSDYPDWVQAYAAGMLEGSLTWQLIYWHWKNTVQSICETRPKFCNYVRRYLQENLKYVQKQYQDPDDSYWYQIHLFYIQLEGIKQGFEHGVKRSRQSIEELDFIDFLWLNAVSDIVDLEYKFFDTKPYSAAALNHSHVPNFISDSVLLKKIRSVRSVDGYSVDNEDGLSPDKRKHFGCGVTLGSAFVKIVPETGHLFVAHNSAGPYVSMLKMMKHYHLSYHWSASNFWMIKNKVSFSSYPGAIHSMDDFYIIKDLSTNSEMIVTGTPITVFDKNLWRNVSAWRQVLSGPRIMVANHLATNASTWARYLSKYNSGTGNKQWSIIDVDRYMAFVHLRRNADQGHDELHPREMFCLVEQIPGHFIIRDETEMLLSKTYWASYGLPYYKNITLLTGLDKIREKYGDTFSYENSPLAKIYKRDEKNATNLSAVMKLMRSNSYRKDPLSLGNPKCAIGARGDIPSTDSYSFPIGVTDSKIYSARQDSTTNDTKTLQNTSEVPETDEDPSTKDTSPTVTEKSFLRIIAGPAHSLSCSTDPEEEDSQRDDDDILEPFNWPESLFADFPHNGHPDVWNFPPITVT